MRYRLDSEHYIQDRLLPAGTEVGDGTPHPYRQPHDVASKDGKGRPVVLKAGSPLPPSREMTPMDSEAERLYQNHFSEGAPMRDPTASIPLQGTGDKVMAPGPAAARPSASAPMAMPKPSVAPPATGLFAKPSLDPKAPGTADKPEGHDSSKNPGDSKDTETAKAPDVTKL